MILDRPRLAASPRHLVRASLRLLWAREHWPLGEMGFEAWDRLAGVVFGEQQAVDLPGHIHARLRGRVLQIGRMK